MKHTILVLDDDVELANLVSEHLRLQDYNVITFQNPLDAVKFIQKDSKSNEVKVIISDVRMPEMNGIELTELIQNSDVKAPIILMTAFGSIPDAIEAIRKGAFDYIAKPFKLTDLDLSLNRALTLVNLQDQNSVLSSELKKSSGAGEIVSQSSAMKDALDLSKKAAILRAPVLILGERGTGKELLARTIHNWSSVGKSNPFVYVSCADYSPELLRELLFGKLSSTGEVISEGYLSSAGDGTLYLADIGNMDLETQARLSQALQEKVYTLESRYFSVRARLICSSTKDFKKLIRDGLFREDLYYRINILPLVLPPLRQRQEDILPLVEYLNKKHCALSHTPTKKMSSAAIETILQLRYEGNIDELENLIARAVALSTTPTIEVAHLQHGWSENFEKFYGQAIEDLPTLEQLEKRYMELVLEKTGHRKEKTAQILGINRRTLYRKEREYGFVVDDGSHSEEE